MTVEALIYKLNEIAEKDYDNEAQHFEADELLLLFINNRQVSDAFHEINKWYA